MSDNSLPKPQHPNAYYTCNRRVTPILLSLGVLRDHLEWEVLDAIEYQIAYQRFPHGDFHMGMAIKILWNAGDYDNTFIEDLQQTKSYLWRYYCLQIKNSIFDRLFSDEKNARKEIVTTCLMRIDELIGQTEAEEEEQIRNINDHLYESDVYVKVEPLEDISNDDDSDQDLRAFD